MLSRGYFFHHCGEGVITLPFFSGMPTWLHRSHHLLPILTPIHLVPEHSGFLLSHWLRGFLRVQVRLPCIPIWPFCYPSISLQLCQSSIDSFDYNLSISSRRFLGRDVSSCGNFSMMRKISAKSFWRLLLRLVLSEYAQTLPCNTSSIRATLIV